MVATCKSHSIRKALIYLALAAYLSGCGEPTNKTIVTLHFKNPTSLEKVIQESLGGEVDFEIAGQEIIFFARKNRLKATLELLTLLDRGPALYRLSFSRKHKHHYSTETLPYTLTLLEGEYSSRSQSNFQSHYKIERRNKSQSLLLIETQSKKKLQSQYILMTHGKWLEVRPATLNNSVKMKLDLLEEPGS